MDRQQFFRLAGTVMALPWLELFTPTTPTPVPKKIDLIEIEHIRSATDAFRSWDYTHLTFVEMALIRPDRLTATERASLHAQRAQALAALGHVQQTLAAIGIADDELTRANRAEDGPWIDFYDDAQHHRDTGRALFDLAIAGRETQSAQRLAYAVANYGTESVRASAMSQTKLASLLMATSDPHEAATLGQQALNTAAGLRSGRATEELRQLRRLAERHAAITETVDLRDRITETLDTNRH
jgi:hypothetical protein